MAPILSPLQASYEEYDKILLRWGPGSIEQNDDAWRVTTVPRLEVARNADFSDAETIGASDDFRHYQPEGVPEPTRFYFRVSCHYLWAAAAADPAANAYTDSADGPWSEVVSTEVLPTSDPEFWSQDASTGLLSQLAAQPAAIAPAGGWAVGDDSLLIDYSPQPPAFGSPAYGSWRGTMLLEADTDPSFSSPTISESQDTSQRFFFRDWEDTAEDKTWYFRARLRYTATSETEGADTLYGQYSPVSTAEHLVCGVADSVEDIRISKDTVNSFEQFEIDWARPRRSETYHVEGALDPAFSEGGQDSPLSEWIFDQPRPRMVYKDYFDVAEPTTYYFRVWAYGDWSAANNGRAESPSETVALTVLPPQEGYSIEEAPALEGPGEGVPVGNQIRFRWPGVLGAHAFELEKAAAPSFDGAECSKYQSAGGFHSVSRPASATGAEPRLEYYRLRAVGGEEGGVSPWSEVLAIEILPEE